MKQSTRLGILTAAITLLAIGGITSATAQSDPSPRLKQLSIGCYTYMSSAIWSNAALRDWYAERYAFVIGSGADAGTKFAQMRTINPNLLGLKYEIFVFQASDTVDLKNWCQQKGYDFHELVHHVPAGQSITVRSDDLKDWGFGRFVTTNGPSVMLMPGYSNSQTRFVWDYRDPRIGEYMAERWKAAVEAIGYDGAFVDEEAIIGHTNNSPQGIYPIHMPYKSLSSSLWQQGSPYTSLENPWGSNFDLEDAGSDHSYVDIRDSLRRAREGWMKVAGDLMASWGLLYAPNFAAVPVNHLNNWNGEGRRASQLAGSYIMGEYSYFYPGEQNLDVNCYTAIAACRSARNDGTNIFLGWIRMGQYDLSQGKSYERSQMNGLGLMLACLFPGPTNYHFSPCVKNGQVDFMLNHTVNGITEDDSTTMWCDAWGKYFGVPVLDRDTLQEGNDPAGQFYRLYQVELMDPSDTTRVQTRAIGRFARGGNFDRGQTAISYALGGSFYELQPDGSFTGPMTSASFANAEFRIFVADTLLANNGPGGGGVVVDSVAPSQIQDLDAQTGQSFGQLDLFWTAPGDDGSTGRAASYDIRYIDSASGPLTISNWSQATPVVTAITPDVNGQSETLTLTSSDGLAPGEPYFFGIRAYDDAGNVAPLSNTVIGRSNSSIVTETGDDCAPTPLSPLPGAMVASARPSLVVRNIVCDSSGPFTYTFEVATDEAFFSQVTSSGPVSEGAFETAWTIDQALESGQRYWWRARANSFPTTTPQSFTIKVEPFAYPTRVDASSTVQEITFAELPANAALQITTVSGGIVLRREGLSEGTFVWDTNGSDGRPVASGVYSWTITSDQGTTRGQVMIIR